MKLGLDIGFLAKFKTLVEKKQDAVVRMDGRWMYWEVKGTDTR